MKERRGRRGVVAEGAMCGEGVKMEDGAGFHRHRDSSFDLGGAVGEGEFAVTGVVADHVGLS
jgi:hypothetical protein